MSLGLLLVTIIAFSGFATATTVSNTGSNVHYITSSEKSVNNWYITTSTDKKNSTFVFKYTMLKHTSKGWVNLGNSVISWNFLKVSTTTTKVTFKQYFNGKLKYSQSNNYKTSLTPLNSAKSTESTNLKYFKTLYYYFFLIYN